MDSSTTRLLPQQAPRTHSRPASQAPRTDASFLQSITRDRANHRLLLIALAGTILQFIVFKILYPFPDFFSDSYSYIYAAYAHLDVSIWPIGYSKFLAAFHTLTHSDSALVGFQYFLLELAALYFYLSLLYFYRPEKATRVILFLFLFFNPLFLYLSNYVNSDPLFAALSLCWFTELLWIINRPRLYQVVTQGVFLFLAFTVRNNAYIYPLVGIIAFLFSWQRAWIKLAGCLLGPALILPFVLHTRAAAKAMTGTAQYSLFTGWQLANNALYMYGHIQVDSNLLPSAASRDLDRISRCYYRKVPNDFSRYLSDYVGNYFIRQEGAPLKRYFLQQYSWQDEYGSVVAWGKASALFDEYGSCLIKKHPLSFARYFVLPNIRNYLMPPLEKLKTYNLGQDEVDAVAEDWFDYTSTDISAVSKNIQGKVLFLLPYLFLLTNIYFIGNLIRWGAIQKARRLPRSLNATTFVVCVLMAANFIFCVTATSIVFRYQVFPFIICLVFSLLMASWIEDPLIERTKIHTT